MQVKAFFADSLQVFRLKTGVVLVYFANEDHVRRYCERKRVKIENNNVNCSFYQQPMSGGMYTNILDALAHLLQTQYNEMKIITGMLIIFD